MNEWTSRTPTEMKNCKLENPALLFGPLAQYLGSDKQWVLSPCVTYKSLSAMKEKIFNRVGEWWSFHCSATDEYNKKYNV